VRSSAKEEEEFFRQDWSFALPGKKTNVLQPGNYEHEFSLVIPGDMVESVEGLPDSWLIYRMKATIDRGWWASNLYARQHIRIIRTFDPSSLELAHAMVLLLSRRGNPSQCPN
jgi:arrestin-related trafficking adapter 4/5/7